MAPAPLPSMSATGSFATTDPRAWQGDPLVPILDGEAGAPDPVALATRHPAPAAATAGAGPHDIFALWLFPVSGGVVLLGPEALAHDHVHVPLPTPQLLQDDLYRLEEVLRRGGGGGGGAAPRRRARW